MDEKAILESVTTPGERGAAQDLHRRLRWGLTREDRATIKAALMEAITVGRPETDEEGNVTYRKPGPRTLATLTKALAELNKQDQADVHHLEGSKVNIAATVSKAPDEEAAELLAEMRRGDLKPRAN